MIIGYAFMVADLLHFGHINFLRKCKDKCDYLIVGVYTDELTATYKRYPIIPFEERFELVRELQLVDEVVKVTNRSCIPMLKKLAEEDIKISFLFHGSDWSYKTDPDLKKSKDYIESIGGKLYQPKYYMDRSTTSIIQEVINKRKVILNSDIKTDLFLREFRTIVGQRVVHSWAELFFLEQIFHKYSFDNIVEIGTYKGGLSLFFGLHALAMGAKVTTFDVKPEPIEGVYPKLKPLLPIEFHQLDAYEPEAIEIIKKCIGSGRALVYCDGGDKTRGFKLFAPMLKVNDVIMAHDRDNEVSFEQAYAREIRYDDIKDAIKEWNLEPFHEEEVSNLGSIIGFIKHR